VSAFFNIYNVLT